MYEKRDIYHIYTVYINTPDIDRVHTLSLTLNGLLLEIQRPVAKDCLSQISCFI